MGLSENNWLRATRPDLLLKHLGPSTSPRKIRLLAAACVARHVIDLPAPHLAAAIEGLVRYADRVIDPAALAALHRPEDLPWARPRVSRGESGYSERTAASLAALLTGAELHHDLVMHCCTVHSQDRTERLGQCDLIRDIFGNPFHPVAFDPAWCTEVVGALARGMYEAQDFAAMPVLADALDDAGCADADVLAHCRGPGQHVRGCWVVDLVLGKA